MYDHREEREELETLNQSVLFLLVLIAAVLLSFAATVRQRDGLARALCCRQEDTTDVFALRWPAAILVAFSTGWFAWQACRAVGALSGQESCAQRRSAHANLLAAILVFVAGLVRLDDLKQTGLAQQNELPEGAPEPG